MSTLGAEKGRFRRSQRPNGGRLSVPRSERAQGKARGTLARYKQGAAQAHGQAVCAEFGHRGVQDHWKAEEVEEHLKAARAINDEQAQSAEKIISSHKPLKKLHSELTVSAEILRQAIMQIQEQSKVKAMSKGKKHVNKREQTEVRIQEQEQGTTCTSNHKPQPKYAKPGLQTKACSNPANSATRWTKDARKPHVAR